MGTYNFIFKDVIRPSIIEGLNQVHGLALPGILRGRFMDFFKKIACC